MTETISTCRAPQCSTEVPSDKPFCFPHWRLIPSRLQNRLYHAKSPDDRESAIEACATFIEMAEFGARLI